MLLFTYFNSYKIVVLYRLVSNTIPSFPTPLFVCEFHIYRSHTLSRASGDFNVVGFLTTAVYLCIIFYYYNVLKNTQTIFV